MDLHLKKIHFVQEFLRLNNAEIIDKLEILLKKEKKKLFERELQPMTLNQLNSLVENAENDVKNNRVKNAHQLKKDIDSWE